MSKSTVMESKQYSKVHKPADEVKLKHGPELSSSTEKDDHPKPNGHSESHKELKEEKDSLFVVDRTHNFKLHRAIQFDSSTFEKNNHNKNNSGAGSKQNSCWNCGSVEHALYGCPEPKNHRKINQNRQIFLNEKQQQQNNKSRNFNQRNVRYFVENNLMVCSDFTPGKLSDELLDALELPKNSIPLHVYKMREIGYPTGWLNEAREEYSGISIFTEPNKSLPFPVAENIKNNILYCNINEKKLHEYPGFNVPCPPDTIDEYDKFGSPEFNPDQSNKIMIERLKSQHQNEKLTGFTAESSNNEVIELISKSNEKLTKEESVTLKISERVKLSDEPPSSPEDGEITEDENSSEENVVESPSNEAVPKTSIDEASLDTSENCIDNKESMDETFFSLSDSINFESGLTPSITTPESSKKKFGDIKSEVLGTPILKHASTFENRPTHEQFAKGMVDLIDHENLPNAIGAFDKIKEILKDVRKTMSNLL